LRSFPDLMSNLTRSFVYSLKTLCCPVWFSDFINRNDSIVTKLQAGFLTVHLVKNQMPVHNSCILTCGRWYFKKSQRRCRCWKAKQSHQQPYLRHVPASVSSFSCPELDMSYCLPGTYVLRDSNDTCSHIHVMRYIIHVIHLIRTFYIIVLFYVIVINAVYLNTELYRTFSMVINIYQAINWLQYQRSCNIAVTNGD